MKKQVDKQHYEFLQYVSKARWNSYYHQIEEVVKVNPKNILIVGVGDNIVVEVIKKAIPKAEVHTIDIDSELKPTYVGSIIEVSKVLNNKKYDVVLCSQVLEHIPFDLFENTIQEISKINTSKLVLSLPYVNIKLRLNIKAPKVDLKMVSYIDRFYKTHKFDGEHYWELGTKQVKAKDIIRVVSKYYRIEKEFVVDENSYHKFFILTK